MLEQRATRLEADFIRALAPLSDTIRRQRAIEQERLVAALDSERYRGLVQRLGTVAPEAGGRQRYAWRGGGAAGAPPIARDAARGRGTRRGFAA